MRHEMLFLLLPCVDIVVMVLDSGSQNSKLGPVFTSVTHFSLTASPHVCEKFDVHADVVLYVVCGYRSISSLTYVVDCE